MITSSHHEDPRQAFNSKEQGDSSQQEDDSTTKAENKKMHIFINPKEWPKCHSTTLINTPLRTPAKWKVIERLQPSGRFAQRWNYLLIQRNDPNATLPLWSRLRPELQPNWKVLERLQPSWRYTHRHQSSENKCQDPSCKEDSTKNLSPNNVYCYYKHFALRMRIRCLHPKSHSANQIQLWTRVRPELQPQIRLLKVSSYKEYPSQDSTIK